MGDIPELLLSVALAYGTAIVAWPILRMPSRYGWGFSVCCGGLVLFCPLLISADRVGLRALAAFLCIDLMFKMLDYSRQLRRRRSDVPRFVDYAQFLIPFPVLLVVFGWRERRLSMGAPRRPEVLRLLFGASLFASGFFLVHLVSRIAVVRSFFLVDHAVKIVIFIITIEGLSRMLNGLERLAGFDAMLIVRNAFLSRTVAEFWSRFNTRVHSWFVYNVFRPTGGRRAPVWGVLLSFFISGVLHELMFGIATSRFDGYQFAFFMLQAPAVLVSGPMNRFAKRGGMFGKAVAHAGTVLWMSVTSIFFFHGVNRVFPFFYASEPWLP